MTSTITLGRRGVMLVLSSPSGAGKTSIARGLLDMDTELEMSISVTTRPKRPGEVEGRDYHFTDRASFDRLAAAGELLEHAIVFENAYGTPRAPVEEALAAGRDVLFDIDWQGTQELAEKMRKDLVTVFILPPTAEALRQRLTSRAADAPEIIAKRMAKAGSELSHYPEYDYVVINRDLERSIAKVRAILMAERLRRSRLINLTEFVRGLQQDV